MEIKKNLLYTENHEWVKIKGMRAYVGITDFAQEKLGDVVFADLPDIDEEFNCEDAFGVIESVKAASDVYMPLSGTVLEVNDNVMDDPSLINQEPYQSWLIYIKMLDKEEIENLMSPEEYEKFCNEV